MKASKEQEFVYRTWAETDSNIMINAVSGSGKSTVILNLIKQSKGRFLYLAFNKSINEEMSRKLRISGVTNAETSTLHSLGLEILKNTKKRIVVQKNKNYDLLKKFQDANPEIFKNMKWKTKLKIGFSLNNLWDASRLFFTKDYEVLCSNLINMGKPVGDIKNLKVLWENYQLFCDSSYEPRKVFIDFIDMIYLPVKFNLPVDFTCKYLAIDEAQDLSYAQHRLIQKIIKDCKVEKCVIVGDKRQSIYGFSGSHSSSFDLFSKMDNLKELPLSTCYRCSPEIVEAANKVYNVMTPFNKSQGDKVRTIRDTAEMRLGSMVICRNTTPLLNLYFQLISEQHPAYLVGKDITDKLLKALKPYKYKTMGEALKELLYERDKLENSQKENERIRFYILRETITNLGIVMRNLCDEYTPVSKFEEIVKKMFVRKNNATLLMTIHKSKGLEADTVYILNEHLIPSKFAVTEDQLRQEQNLKYVARTRAKKKMYYLTLKFG